MLVFLLIMLALSQRLLQFNFKQREIMYRRFFKRAIDIVASGCALVVLAVPLADTTVL